MSSGLSGMQNAMTTNYGSAVVRTTHVTGSITDIGIVLGRIIVKGDYSQLWKLQLLSAFVLSFAIGAGCGTGLYMAFDILGLIVPATIMLLLGISYRIYVGCDEPRGPSENSYTILNSDGAGSEAEKKGLPSNDEGAALAAERSSELGCRISQSWDQLNFPSK